MDKKEVQERIEKLKKIINKARYAYHVLDKPIIPDDVLDSLKHELFELEKKYPEFTTPDSPTQRIGGRPLEKFKKVEHKVPQWSFNDAFSKKEIYDFDKRIKKELGISEINYTAELKIDGLHVILTYKNGLFVLGATRGDGKIGEDVTQNLKTIESIPLRLNKDISLVVEGEVYIKKSVFEKINKKRKEEGFEPLANPRNAAAGGIRQLDPRIAKERHLDCFVYDYSWPEKDAPQTQYEELKKLQELGFKVERNYKYCQNINEAILFWEKWDKKREVVDYWIDGVVVKVNKREYQKRLGYTGKAPRWSVAFKWPGEKQTTVVKDILIQVGRTGKLTPVAILEPVSIRGTVVSRATLHNADEIERIGIKIGDTVIVQKAGDVIPQVVKIIPELRPRKAKEFKTPSNCPFCKSKIIKPEGEVNYYCSNKNCGAQRKNQLYYFVSKKAFDIVSLGPKIIDRFMDEGLISDAPDIFLLKKEDIAPLERFAEKSAQNIIDSINSKKEIELSRLIIACQIKYIGEESAKLLDEQLGSNIRSIKEFIEFFQSLPQEKLEQIKEIGPKVSRAIKNWFSIKENIEFLKKLNKVGVKIKSPLKNKQKSQKLKGMTFVFTGELESMAREEAKKVVEERGGEVTNFISKNTDFLVIGKNPGSKYEKAKKLGVKMVNEEHFLRLIKK